jgi:hypothetical protein
MTPDVHAAQNEIANPTYDNDPIEEKTTPSRANAADSWGPGSNKKASLANLAPYLLPYFNNGPVFGCQEPTREISAIALNRVAIGTGGEQI